MCQVLEDLMITERTEGSAEGVRKRALKTAKTMLEPDKYPLTETVLLRGLSVEEVKKLAWQMGRVSA